MLKRACCLILVLLPILVFDPNVHAGGGYTAGIALVNQAVSVPVTAVKCSAACAAGVYRVSLSCITTKAGKGSVAISFSWSNFGHVETQTSGSCDLKTLGSNIGSVSVFYLDGTVPPTYSATVGAPGPAGAVWRGNVTLEQLQ